MSAHNEIAKVYASALLELAVAQGALTGDGNSGAKQVGEELAALCEVFAADKKFVSFLGSPAVSRARRTETIDRVLKGRVSDLLYRFVITLNRKGRLGHLLAIGEAYDALLQELFGMTEVDVYTVDGKSMGESTESLMREKLRAAIGKEAIFHYYSDPAMIGGIKLQIGDQLVDGSVATRLRRLQHAMIESGGATVRRDSKRFIG
ncbi:MAG: ATP synthase F1 subunit delta [Phycisphaerales bacterium]|nr:ATP synthase F1 subunit delta [Phycisphaerales bacterium]